MKNLQQDEKKIVGDWLVHDGKVEGDYNCKRIEWLVENRLLELGANGDNWSILYQNPDDKKYWEYTYPKSHMHGGGPPSLTMISEQEAKEKYDLNLSKK